MLRYRTILLIVVIALGLTSLSAAVAAEETDPATVVEAVYEAVEAKDLESAGTYLAEDVVLVLMPPPPGTDGTFVGKEAVLGWYENLIDLGFAVELSDATVDGDRVTISNLTWVDDLPIAPVAFDGTGIVQDGLVKTMSWVITPESMAEMDAAMKQQANRAIVERFMVELWNQGDLSVLEEIVADDFVSHSWPIVGGDRAALGEVVAGFREAVSNNYFTIDDMVVTEDRVFFITVEMSRPEGASEDAVGEPVTDPIMVVLGVEDGKISDRWIYLTPTEDPAE